VEDERRALEPPERGDDPTAQIERNGQRGDRRHRDDEHGQRSGGDPAQGPSKLDPLHRGMATPTHAQVSPCPQFFSLLGHKNGPQPSLSAPYPDQADAEFPRRWDLLPSSQGSFSASTPPDLGSP